MPDRYYADLNPDYGARYERRWAVFSRETRHRVYGMHYVTRKAAERNAAKLSEQERDPLYEPTQDEIDAYIAKLTTADLAAGIE